MTAAALGKHNSRTALEKEALAGKTFAPWGKEEEMALDLLPFSGAQIMEKEGVFLEAFFPQMEGRDHHLQTFFHGMNALCVAVCSVVFDSLDSPWDFPGKNTGVDALVTLYKNICNNRGSHPSPPLSHHLSHIHLFDCTKS